jgi:hypothetical protein
MFSKQNKQQHSSSAFAAGALFAILIAGMLRPGFAATTDKPVFSSPEEAVEALYKAVQTDDQSTMARLLGQLTSSDDVVQDKADRERFIQKYSEMHRLVKQPDGTTSLYIGAENWSFPIPLVANGGKWSFDLDAGAQEVIFRRVGEDETEAIETSRAIAQAISHAESTTNDPAIDNYVRNILGPANPPEDSFHGYQFRILRRPNGAVVVAYPSEYGVTGVMTFAAAPDGTVYEKDLGPKTGEAAHAMARYKRDRTWQVAEQ